jgi:hypothetical protein
MLARLRTALAILALMLDVSHSAALADNSHHPKVSSGSSPSQFWLELRASTEARHVADSVVQEPHSRTAMHSSAARSEDFATAMLMVRMVAIAFCGGGQTRLLVCPNLLQAAAPRAAAPPQVTPGAVLTALRRIGLPAVQAHTQPRDKTLVNFATIFYADPHDVARTITLLGQQVQVAATPRSYTWHFGDGASRSTTSPGAPYPAMDVTHEYARAHLTVQTSVDVTYAGRFRVGAGGWQVIPGTVTIGGPGVPLRVSEATPMLSGSDG